jgi:phosphohistidine phosphatase
MHRLHLLRHAKASSEEGLEDRERRLTRRGREAARRVGASLPAALGAIDLVLCSSARRTRETAELALADFIAQPRIAFEDELYLAGPGALLRRLRRLDEAENTVLVIGHNPGLHELAIMLAAPDSPRFRSLVEGKFPTIARASFAIDTPWTALDRSRHRLVDYVTVKSGAAEN